MVESRAVKYNQLDYVCHTKDESGRAVERQPIYRKQCAMIILYVSIEVPRSLSQAHTYAYVWWFDIYW